MRRQTMRGKFGLLAMVIAMAIAMQCLLVSPVLGRKWTDETGKRSVEAEFVRVENGNVVLKKQDGSQSSMPPARLNTLDLDFILAVADRDLVRAVAKQEDQLRLVVQTGHGMVVSLLPSPLMASGSSPWDTTGRSGSGRRTPARNSVNLWAFVKVGPSSIPPDGTMRPMGEMS